MEFGGQAFENGILPAIRCINRQYLASQRTAGNQHHLTRFRRGARHGQSVFQQPRFERSGIVSLRMPCPPRPYARTAPHRAAFGAKNTKALPQWEG